MRAASRLALAVTVTLAAAVVAWFAWNEYGWPSGDPGRRNDTAVGLASLLAAVLGGALLWWATRSENNDEGPGPSSSVEAEGQSSQGIGAVSRSMIFGPGSRTYFGSVSLEDDHRDVHDQLRSDNAAQAFERGGKRNGQDHAGQHSNDRPAKKDEIEGVGSAQPDTAGEELDPTNGEGEKPVYLRLTTKLVKIDVMDESFAMRFLMSQLEPGESDD